MIPTGREWANAVPIEKDENCQSTTRRRTIQSRRQSQRARVLLTAIAIFHTSCCEGFNSVGLRWRNEGIPMRTSTAGITQGFHLQSCRPQFYVDGKHETRRMAMLHRNGSVQEKDDGRHDIPRHVAFVCDGNSRWASSRFLPTAAGHAVGAQRLIETLNVLKRAGVEYCTMYGFSTENWRRPPGEIQEILRIMEETARGFYAHALAEHVRIKILGDLDDARIPSSLRDALQTLERETAVENSSISWNGSDDAVNETRKAKFTVCLAVNYGGRSDIVNAGIQLAKALAAGDMEADQLSEDDFASLLCTSEVPDPDLIIRTGGERRLSNFLLWNAAYAELYFVDTLWPDFDETCLEKALVWFSSRSRRFGGRLSREAKVSNRTTSH